MLWKITELIKDIKHLPKLKEENQQLKKYFEKESYVVDKLTRQLTQEYKNTNNVTHRLKQRDEVIDEAIEFILSHTYYNSSTKTNNGVIIDNDINELLEILQKWK